MSEVLQLIHADGVRNGNRYQWKTYYEPSKEILAEFDRLSNLELEDL